MPILTVCPGCHREYQVKAGVEGKKFRCQVCQTAGPRPESRRRPVRPSGWMWAGRDYQWEQSIVGQLRYLLGR